MKIVIIDDSPTALVLLGSLSAKLKGAQPITFSDPIAADAHLQANSADLIIVDYSMPQLTGMELIKRLRGVKHHASTPVILVTTSYESAIRSRAKEVGATAFIQKPINAREFIHCATSVMQRTMEHAGRTHLSQGSREV